MPAPDGPQWRDRPKPAGRYRFVPAQTSQGEHDWRADNRQRETAARTVTDRRSAERQEREQRADQIRETGEESSGRWSTVGQVRDLILELRPDMPHVLAESFAAEAMHVDDSPTIAELHPDARWQAIREETARAEEARKAEAHAEADRLRADIPLPVEHYSVSNGRYQPDAATDGPAAAER